MGRLSEAVLVFPSQHWPRFAAASSPGSPGASARPWGAPSRPPGPSLRLPSECGSFCGRGGLQFWGAGVCAVGTAAALAPVARVPPQGPVRTERSSPDLGHGHEVLFIEELCKSECWNKAGAPEGKEPLHTKSYRYSGQP